MVQRISRIFFAALLAATTLAADGPVCTATPRECEEKIRQLVSGRRYLGVTVIDKSPGLEVSLVLPNSPAERAGLKVGDVLISLNGKSLTKATGREFKQYIADARNTGRIWMIVSRRGAFTEVTTRLEPYSNEQIAKMVNAHLAQAHSKDGSQR